MARLPRIDLPGETHIVTQRLRLERQALFDDEQTRLHYMALLTEVLPTVAADIYAYGLWRDRVYLLLGPREHGSIGRLVQAHGRRFVPWANRLHGWEGSLWQGRFMASPVDPAWLVRVMRFIEAPFIQGGGAEIGCSSYPHHIGLARDRWLQTPPAYWSLGNTPFDREAAYRAMCEEGAGATEREHIAYASAHGWCIGSARYCEAMTETTARPLAPRRRGRPSKPRKN